MAKKVAYYYDPSVGSFYYGAGHPMKPHRIRMTHNLLMAYGLYQKMEIYRPVLLSEEEMTAFHADDYVYFLKHVSPENLHEFSKEMSRYNVDQDCPVFSGLYQFCQISSGGSVGGAFRLNMGMSDVAINWAGGLHHAKKSEASGFCYINDIVLAILELLKFHQRVLYIDIDVHHGDGVEEAFYTSNRVMTLSFHKYGDFFPGTGDVKDVGHGDGRNYALNFPLNEGIDDESYESIFKPIVQKVIDCYRPGAIVLQCGADSLTGDRLGCFNLSIKGHGKCVEYVKSLGLPLLVLGGGGYTIRNVSRCWTYETSLCLDVTLNPQIPPNDYYEYFCPDFNLFIPQTNRENLNTKEYLENTKSKLLEMLRTIEQAPSVQMHEVPRDQYRLDNAKEMDPDIRVSQEDQDRFIESEKEFYRDDLDQDESPNQAS